MTTAIRREAPHHNNLTCVKHYGCQLPECRDRFKAYHRNRYHSRAAGTWQPLVDAEPVRQHLLNLYAADFGPVRVSELANLPYATVIGFTRVHGNSNEPRARKRRCTPEVAAKILAITPDTATPGCVNATGTRRRVQALVAAGWPMSHLALRFGLSERAASSFLTQDRVYGRTAKAVAEAYQQLAGVKPEKRGVSATSALRARKRAAQRRWATVAYWADRMDVIDDEHFEPLYGVSRREIVAQDAHWLMTTNGLDKSAAAERLGVDKSYIDHAFRDHPQYALKAAA
jgi:hypothetical protein